MTTSRTHQTDDWWLTGSALATWRSRPSLRPALLLWLISLASASLAPAQAVVMVEEEEEVVLAVDAGFEFAESNFDQWIFGVAEPDHGLKRIESLLTLNVDAINQVCGLTEDQAAKLNLAGQGDIKRFYDEVAVLRAKFMRVRRNRNAVNQFYQEIQPVKAKLDAGLFDEGSFFHKVLNGSLDDEQSSKYEEAQWNRRQARYHAKLGLALVIMERTMPLRAAQRERLIEVLQEETQPPKVFGQYDYYVVLYQLSQISDQKLKPIFDEAQWKVFAQMQAQGRAMGIWIKQQKLLP